VLNDKLATDCRQKSRKGEKSGGRKEIPVNPSPYTIVNEEFTAAANKKLTYKVI
jgi:hypothetical protein